MGGLRRWITSLYPGRQALSRGDTVVAWTVNSEAALKELVALGVNGIITDNPALLHRIVMDYGHKRSGLTPPLPPQNALGRLRTPGAQRTLPSAAYRTCRASLVRGMHCFSMRCGRKN